MLIGPELLRILATKDYWDGKFIIPIMMMTSYINFVYTFFVNVEHYYKKTINVSLNTVVAAIFNIILNYYFISKWGYIGASISTLLAYIISLSLHVYVAKQLQRNLFDVKTYVYKITVVLIAIFIYYVFINNIYARWGMTAIAILLYFVHDKSLIIAIIKNRDKKMFDFITAKDVLQIRYLNKLECVSSKLLPNINLKKALFLETFYCQNLSFKKFVRFILRFILTNDTYIKANISNKKILSFYTKNYRKDHDEYWDSINKDIPAHDEIVILNKTSEGKNFFYRISLKEIIRKTFFFIVFYKELNVIPNLQHRMYLSAQLTDKKLLLEKIKKNNLSPKLVMCFFDSSKYESVIMQFFKQNKIITVTNQHGQPLFRSQYYDLVNQSQILNCISDFYLAKGNFQIQQFTNAGIKSQHIYCVGILDNNKHLFKLKNVSTIGIYLDTPGLMFSNQSNSMLISNAREIAKKLNIMFFVKTHPTDNVDKYSFLKKDKLCIGVFGRDLKLSQAMKMNDLAIIHASSTYVDAYFYGVRCLKLNSKFYFPISIESDNFNNIDQAIRIITQWNSTSFTEKKSYIKCVQKKYDIGWKQGNFASVLNELANICS